MKKIIQICSLFTLLVLFGAVAANAQSSFGSDVEIPFAFNVGDRSYEAGNYIVKLEALSMGGAKLSIHDTKNDEVQMILINGTGEDAGKDVNLVFDVIDGKRFLTKVRTPERTYALFKSKAEKNAAKAEKAAEGAAVGGSSSF